MRGGQVHKAGALVQSLSPDLGAVAKPFFTHFAAGQTTEMVTAHGVADIIADVVSGEQKVMPSQIALDGEWLDLHGVVAVPVITSIAPN